MSAKPARRSITIPAYTEVVSRDGMVGFVETLNAVQDPQYRDQISPAIRRKAEAILEMQGAENATRTEAATIGKHDTEEPGLWNCSYVVYVATIAAVNETEFAGTDRYVLISRLNNDVAPDDMRRLEPMLAMRLRDAAIAPRADFTGTIVSDLDDFSAFRGFSDAYCRAVELLNECHDFGALVH